MPAALYAVVSENGALRVMRVPVSHANDRFVVLAAPYPLPNGTTRRIFNLNEPLLPDTPEAAVRYHLTLLAAEREAHEEELARVLIRIRAAEALLSRERAAASDTPGRSASGGTTHPFNPAPV